MFLAVVVYNSGAAIHGDPKKTKQVNKKNPKNKTRKTPRSDVHSYKSSHWIKHHATTLHGLIVSRELTANAAARARSTLLCCAAVIRRGSRMAVLIQRFERMQLGGSGILGSGGYCSFSQSDPGLVGPMQNRNGIF